MFFNPSKPEDLKLLHTSVRESEEIFDMSEQVEYEVIEYFRQRPDLPLYFRTGFENLNTLNRTSVRLIGYNEETPEDSTDELKEALRRTIAFIVSYVLRNYDNALNVNSIRQGNRSISYKGQLPDADTWPDNWLRYLRRFDDKEAQFSI